MQRTANRVVTTLLLTLATSTIPGPVRAQSADWQEGVSYVRSALKSHTVVGLGEVHELVPYFDFVDQLLADAEIWNSLDDIVVEFGNARFQGLLDRWLLALEPVPADSLKLVWSEHAESPTGPYESPVYAELVAKVRARNARTTADKRIRIVAGDIPVDWAAVHTREDYVRYGSRSKFLGERVVSQVLARHRRALLLVGGAHLSRVGISPGAGAEMTTTTNVIESAYPGALHVVAAVVSFGPRNDEVLPRLRGVAKGSIAALPHHWLGDLPAPVVLRERTATAATPSASTRTITRRDLFDAYLWLGPLEATSYRQAAPDAYASEARWEELNRRSQIRFGRALDPATRRSGALRPLPAETREGT